MVTRFLFGGGKQAKVVVGGKEADDPPTLQDKQVELAKALYQKGRKQWTKGNKKEAVVLLRKALAIQESSLGGRHKDTAKSYYVLGRALRHGKEYDKALIAYRRTWRSRLFEGGEPATEGVHRSITELLTNKMGKTEEQVNRYFEQAAAAVQWEKDAEALAEKQEFDKAVEAYEKCLAIEDAADGKFALDIGHFHMQMGDALKHNKEYEMALNAYRDALAVYESALGRHHEKTMCCLKGMEDSALGKEIKPDQVEEYVSKSLLSIEHCRKGRGWLESKEFQKAVEEFEAARIMEEASLGKYPLTTADIRKQLATAFESLHEHDRAIFELRTALSIRIFDCGSDHPLVTTTLKDVGAAMKSKGIQQDSINRYMNTVSFSVKHQRYGEHLLAEEEDFSAAIEEFQKSLALEVVALGKYHLTQGALFKGIGDAFLQRRILISRSSTTETLFLFISLFLERITSTPI